MTVKDSDSAAVAAFDTLLGYAPGGIAVYSSDYSSADESKFPNRKSYRSYVDDIFMGYKWQCVEFARRWLYLTHGWVFDNIPMAYDIFYLRSVKSVRDQSILPLRSFLNGAKTWPKPGSMLIWEDGGHFEETGHVAIICEVYSDRIRIAEQNVDHKIWPEGQQWARELPVQIDDDGGYWISCTYSDTKILGWVTQTEDDTYSERFSGIDSRLMKLCMRTSDVEMPQAVVPEIFKPEERAYAAAMGGLVLSRDPDLQKRYVCLSESAFRELRHASNELHAMFLQATDCVMDSDALLSKFGFPPQLWSRLRSSWDNRKNHMITGRLDFAVSESGIKVYEYNADSASCYMECAHIQQLWARSHHIVEGHNGGEHLREHLVHAWKKANIAGPLHILLDSDPEETYHALFMKSTMDEVGIDCRIIHDLKELAWGKNGEVVDAVGTPIHCVWKTWAWETALDQLRAEIDLDTEAMLPDQRQKIGGGRPALIDVLLRKEVVVFEPLWTLVPSNKAILPILWDMFPEHPNLLDTRFELTDALRASGYVEKPIVGRCGANISIVGADQKLVDTVGGQFYDKDSIYQKKFDLPCIDGFYTQISSFVVDGRYAGAGARVDKSPIINGESDILPLRIVPDKTL